MSTTWKTVGLASAAGAAFLGFWVFYQQPQTIMAPEVVAVPAGAYTYRPGGDFRSGNRVVDAPPQDRVADLPFQIMKYHVSQYDYVRCVMDDKCRPSPLSGTSGYAQVNVSYLDATAYAQWLSKRTGQVWRLPTEEEWMRAAGDRFHETLLGPLSNDPDPSKRWVAQYQQEAARRGQSDPKLRKIGHYGENDLGVVDINGNIWEWTVSCFKNGKVSEDATTLISATDYCGVRAAQGKHRAFIIDFVRDAKAGGCAVGIPPDNLGIRLVLDANAN